MPKKTGEPIAQFELEAWILNGVSLVNPQGDSLIRAGNRNNFETVELAVMGKGHKPVRMVCMLYDDDEPRREPRKSHG